MGQPGGNDIEIRGGNMGGNTYYNYCIDCETNKILRVGHVGKYPRNRAVSVKDCKHRGSKKYFEANGALCTGYEPGFKHTK